MEILPGTLMEATIELLLKHKRFLVVSEETGISFFWLRKFAYGEIDNPSVNTVQKLYEYLSGKCLRV